jgi:GNAT superfamily N-acetyltransferase
MQSQSIHIRFAAASDAVLIAALIKELSVYEKMETECICTPQDIEATIFCSPPMAEVLIAELDGAPVGFALFFHNYSTFLGKRGLYLEDLFVRPPARGHGVGKALFLKLAQLAIERDCGRMEWAVLDWNTPAIEFYESFGAKPQTEWSVFRLTREALENLQTKIT